MLRFTFRQLPPPAFLAPLVEIPGVEVARNGQLRVPRNAGQLVAGLIDTLALPVIAAAWEKPPPPALAWDQVRATLDAGGEVKPGIFDMLWSFQRDALAFASDKWGANVWHPTGAGKTLTLLLWSLLHPGPAVVCTGAKARIQWGRAVRRFTHVEPHVIAPPGYIRKGEQLPETLDEYLTRKRAAGERPYVIVGWEGLREQAKSLAALRPASVGLDEVHRAGSHKRWDVTALPDLSTLDPDARAQWDAQIRQAVANGAFLKTDEESKQTKLISPEGNIASSAMQLCRASQRRLATTATPVFDRLRGLWGQLDLVEPNAWGNKHSWLLRYCDRHRNLHGGWDDNGISHWEELVGRLRNVCHVVSYWETHRDLPSKRRESYYVPRSEQCQPSGGYKDMLRKAERAGPSAVLWVGLAEAASRKRKAVLYLAGEHVGSGQPGKVIIFTGTHDDCDRLGEAVRKEFPNVTSWASHGGTPGKRRQQILDEYIAHPGPCILVGTWDAWGESLDGMQDTDALIFAMLPWSPGKVRQGEGRVARGGQKRPVIIYYVIAEGSADERVVGILLPKFEQVAQVAEDEELAQAAKVVAGREDKEAIMRSIFETIGVAYDETVTEKGEVFDGKD